LLGLLGPSARLLNPLYTNKTPLLSRYREQVAMRSVNLPFENEERIMPVLFLWTVPAVIVIGGASIGSFICTEGLGGKPDPDIPVRLPFSIK
jgi:hypothetical protein